MLSLSNCPCQHSLCTIYPTNGEHRVASRVSRSTSSCRHQLTSTQLRSMSTMRGQIPRKVKPNPRLVPNCPCLVSAPAHFTWHTQDQPRHPPPAAAARHKIYNYLIFLAGAGGQVSILSETVTIVTKVTTGRSSRLLGAACVV